MIHRILPVGHNDSAFVVHGAAYTWWELWLAGLATSRRAW